LFLIKCNKVRERHDYFVGQQIWCDSRADGYSPDDRSLQVRGRLLILFYTCVLNLDDLHVLLRSSFTPLFIQLWRPLDFMKVASMKPSF